MEKIKKYSSYKDSGIEWIGEIPSHWEKYRLGVIGKFSSSGVDKKIVETEPQVKIVNYTDVYGNKQSTLDSSIDYMTVTASQSKIDEHTVKKGDLIFTPSSETKEDIGLSAVVVEDLDNTAFSYHVLRFQFDKDVDLNFKKYICNNHFVLNHFSRNSQGTTRQTLGRGDFRNTEILLPPLSEQTAIAAFLDRKTAEIDQLIADKKQLLKLYREEKTAIINRAVTKGINPDAKMKESGIEWLGEIPEHWEAKRLKYVASINDEVLSETTDENYEIRYVEISNVKNGVGIVETTTYLFKDAPSRARRIVKDGDVIVSTVRTYLKSIAKIDMPPPNLIASTGFAVIRPRNLNSDYLGYLFYSEFLIGEIISLSTGVSYPAINANQIGDIFIPIPPLSEQKSIVEFIEAKSKKIDTKIARTEKLIELLTEYRTTLISEVVTGKIMVIES
jgi:type I restriction enzyme S subunit